MYRPENRTNLTKTERIGENLDKFAQDAMMKKFKNPSKKKI